MPDFKVVPEPPGIEWRRGTKRHPMVAQALDEFPNLEPGKVICLDGFRRNTVEAAFKRKYKGQFSISVLKNKIYVRKVEIENDKNPQPVRELMEWKFVQKAIDYYIQKKKSRDIWNEELGAWVGKNRLTLKVCAKGWQLPCYMLTAAERYKFEKFFLVRPGGSLEGDPEFSTLDDESAEKYLSNGTGLGHFESIPVAVSISNDYSDSYDLMLTYPEHDKERIEHEFAQLCAIGKSLYLFRNKHLVFEHDKLLEIKSQNVVMSDVYLPKRTFDSLLGNVVDFYATYEDPNFKSHRGVLVSGPAGNGKTLFAKAIAKKIVDKCTVLWVTGASIAEASNVRDLFDIARALSPVFVIMEDIDGLGTNREAAGNSTGPVLAELLTQMDGAQGNSGIFVFATTNYPEMVDNALRNRPNRFDRHYKIPNPTLDMLRLYLKDKLGFECNNMATKLEKHNFAYAEEVVNTARLMARKEKRAVTEKDVETAWNDMNVTEEDSDSMVA